MAITMKQPFASGISVRKKRVENRTWKPSLPLSGEGMWLGCHAGATTAGPEMQTLVTALRAEWIQMPAALPKSALIGFFHISHVVPASALPHDPQAVGPWCWIIDRVEPLAMPILNVPGGRGLWPLPQHVMNKLPEGLSSRLHVDGAGGDGLSANGVIAGSGGSSSNSGGSSSGGGGGSGSDGSGGSGGSGGNGKGNTEGVDSGNGSGGSTAIPSATKLPLNTSTIMLSEEQRMRIQKSREAALARRRQREPDARTGAQCIVADDDKGEGENGEGADEPLQKAARQSAHQSTPYSTI
jgi:hypothetical protein